MSLSPLFTVQQIYYPVFMVLLNSVYDGKQRKEPKLNIVSKLGKIPRKRKLFGVRLDINTPDGIDPTTFPYVFAISVYGCFQCDDIPDKIEKEAFLLKRKLVYVNGSTILYSAARDRLMLLTGGTPYPSYCLPTYRFDPEDIK